MARTKGAQADQWWAEAIRRVAALPEDTDPEKRKKLTLVAHKLFNAALEGDVSAMKEIGDRLDGRPRQTIAHGAAEELPPVTGIIVQYARPDNPADNG